MLGHQVASRLIKNKKFIVRGTSNNNVDKNLFNLKVKIDQKINIINFKKVTVILKKFKPNFVINCAGVVKKNPDVNNLIKLYSTNSDFPKNLEKLSNLLNYKIIHFSTDCVFNGKKGNYTENDKSNANDHYGISKKLGEIKSKNCLTIRTSIIGHENNKKKYGLLEWFLSQNKSCYGYKKCFFTGLTTNEISKFVEKVISKKKFLNGLYHIHSKKISKFELLKKISKIYKKKIEIKINLSNQIDRSLISRRNLDFYKTPSWNRMIKEMYNEKNKK
jgi:dTDP-4-dehydrorhamnose reductase